jgi:phosphate starvation-inducible PhoH-like protein
VSTSVQPIVILRFTLEPVDNTRLARVCGSLDANLREIEAALAVKIARRDADFRVEGPKQAAERAKDPARRAL